MPALAGDEMIDRRSLSQKRRAQICLAQDGKCFVCGDNLKPGQFEIDHRQALVHGGDDGDDNLRACCLNCHCEKTRADIQANAKVKRIISGGRQRKGPPMPGTKASGIRKRMNGQVEEW